MKIRLEILKHHIINLEKIKLKCYDLFEDSFLKGSTFYSVKDKNLFT